MITIKLPFETDQESLNLIHKLRQQQSCIVRYSFNRFKENLNELQIRSKTKLLNNIEMLDSWFVQCGIKEADFVFKRNPENKVIFGGKYNWKQFILKKITKSEFKENRILPLSVQGESLKSGNRKFELDIIENNQIIFKYKRGIKIPLKLPKLRNSYLKLLSLLEQKSKNKEVPFSIKLTQNEIFISFNENLVESNYNKDLKRVISIDLNPSELGYSILEFTDNNNFKVLETGNFNISQLTEKLNLSSDNSKQIHQNNKRKFEILEISKFLINKSIHFKCCKFVIEDLEINSKNHNKGRNFNRLVNNFWCRNILINNLQKRCNINGIELTKVNPIYSSIIGNLVNSNYPDPISAAIEIGRRGYFKYQKNQFYPKLINIEVLSNRWKETKEWSYQNWKELFQLVKNSKLKYRVSKTDSNVNLVFERKYYKKMISLYCFI
jgi:IS605 OrfB family transposase